MTPTDPIDIDFPPVIFVHIGRTLPKYAPASLRIARRHLPNPIILVSEAEPARPPVTGFSWIPLDEVLDYESFEVFSSKSVVNKSFRDGFWLKAAQRFFAISGAMERAKASYSFHAELDCVLFNDINNIHRAAVQSGVRKAFMIPKEKDGSAIASVVYFVSSDSADEMCAELTEKAHLGNEMDILGAVSAEENPACFLLPTARDLFPREHPTDSADWAIFTDKSRTLFDGAALGRWVFGLDQRNISGGPVHNLVGNSRVSAYFPFPLSGVRFVYNQVGGYPQVLVAEGTSELRPLANLHIHSKIHKKLSSAYLERLLQRANDLDDTLVVRATLAFKWRTLKRYIRYFLLIVRSRPVRNEFIRRLLQTIRPIQ